MAVTQRKRIFRIAPYLALGGLLLGLVTCVFGLGGWVFLAALVAVSVAASIWVAERRGGTESVTAILVFPLVMTIGIVLVHPQGWSSPGKSLAIGKSLILGRAGGCALIQIDKRLECVNTGSFKIGWQRHIDTEASLSDGNVLIMAKDNPAQAHTYLATNGKHLKRSPWVANSTTPEWGRTATDGDYSVALSDATDIAGDEWTKLTIHSPTGEDHYRLNGVDQLQLFDGLLLLNGPSTNRLLVLSPLVAAH